MYYISANYTELITGKDFQKQLFFNKPHFPGKNERSNRTYTSNNIKDNYIATSWTEDVEEEVIIDNNDNNNCNPAAKSALLAP